MPLAAKPRAPSAALGRARASRFACSFAFAFSVALALARAPLPAQTALFTFRGDPETGFGEAIATIGDVDGDRRPDFAISDVEDQRGEGAGRVRVFSGANGVLLYEVVGQAPGSRFGAAICALGDLDHDGASDFAIATGSYVDATGKVQAYSGRTGTLLWTCVGNVGPLCLANGGDIDSDGRPDLLIGCRAGTNGSGQPTGTLRIISGATGAELARIHGKSPDDAFGSAVVGLGDVNRDGVPDFAVGAPVHPDLRSATRRGYAWIFSGANKERICDLACSEPASGFGAALANLGDRDGDGADDLAVGATAPLQSLASAQEQQASYGMGAVLVFSSRGGKCLQRITARAHDQWFGSQIAATLDLDGDGLQEVVAASYDQVIVFGSAQGLPLREFTPTVAGARNRCFRITALGDLDGDGIGEIGVTTRANSTTSGTFHGSAQILSTNLLALSADCHEMRYWKGGAQHLRLQAGKRFAGQPYTLVGTLSGTSPGLQIASARVPLNLDRYLLSSLQIGESPVFQGFRGTLDENGSATAAIHLPPLAPQIKGLTAHHAFVILGDGGISFISNPVPLAFIR